MFSTIACVENGISQKATSFPHKQQKQQKQQNILQMIYLYRCKMRVTAMPTF